MKPQGPDSPRSRPHSCNGANLSESRPSEHEGAAVLSEQKEEGRKEERPGNVLNGKPEATGTKGLMWSLDTKWGTALGPHAHHFLDPGAPHDPSELQFHLKNEGHKTHTPQLAVTIERTHVKGL